jgi:hypothetical protein
MQKQKNNNRQGFSLYRLGWKQCHFRQMTKTKRFFKNLMLANF